MFLFLMNTVNSRTVVRKSSLGEKIINIRDNWKKKVLTSVLSEIMLKIIETFQH